MSWADFIRDCKFGDISFECIATDDDFGSTFDYQRLVNRPGVQIEFRARNERRFSMQVALYTDDYQTIMESLADACEAGKIAAFTHPVFGDFPSCVIDNCRIGHNGDDSDSATMQIVIVEHTPLGLEVVHFSIPVRVQLARSAISDLQAAVDAFTSIEIPSVQGLLAPLETPFQLANQVLNFTSDVVQSIGDDVSYVVDIASQYVDTLERIGDLPDSLGIEAQINRITGKADDISQRIEDYQDEPTHDLALSLISLVAALQELANEIIESRPPLIETVIPVTIPLLAWAHAAYGDSSRVTELLSLNTIMDPLAVPAGFLMRHYAE